MKNPLVLAFIASILFGIWPAFLKIALGEGNAPEVLTWVGLAITLVGYSWRFFDGQSTSLSVNLLGYSLSGGV